MKLGETSIAFTTRAQKKGRFLHLWCDEGLPFHTHAAKLLVDACLTYYYVLMDALEGVNGQARTTF
jgi:hypothetical protein